MLSLLGFSLSLFRTSALEGPPRVFVPNTRAASAHTQNMKSLRDASGRTRPGIAAFRGGSDIPTGALPHRCGHRTPAPQCPLRLPFLNSPLINTHLNPNSHQLSAGIHFLYFLYLTIELNNILSSCQNASSGFTCFIPTIFSMWGQRGPEKFKHPKLRDRFQILREWQIANWRPASRLSQRGCTDSKCKRDLTHLERKGVEWWPTNSKLLHQKFPSVSECAPIWLRKKKENTKQTLLPICSLYYQLPFFPVALALLVKSRSEESNGGSMLSCHWVLF